MKFVMTVLVTILSLHWSSSFAEIYMGLMPGMSVTAVKTKYPNAVLKDLKPAWLATIDRFYSLTGTGISGEILMKFSSVDKTWESLRAEALSKIEASPESDHKSDQAMVDFYSEFLGGSVENRLALDWVRWIPEAAIPLQRLISKYGPAEKCDYKEDSFQPYCNWSSRGISASLTDKKDSVNMIDFFFTQADWAVVMGKPQSVSPSAPSTIKRVPKPNPTPTQKKAITSM